MSRKDYCTFSRLFAASLMTVIFIVGVTDAMPQEDGRRPYLEAAHRAAEWIETTAIEKESGRNWPADPQGTDSVNNTLYAGTPGVVLFFLELYYSTGEEVYLKEACAGADYLLATLSDENESGLYVGLAGVGFALEETYKATKESKYWEGFRACVAEIGNRAVEEKGELCWSDTTDIISGGAGTGLFLLYASRELQDSSLLDLAARAGRFLLGLGKPAGGGLKWAMDLEFPRLMPNFSHGTAGVAYFLATLYKETGGQDFLEGALAGARYLTSVANTEVEAYFIFHHEPGGEDLFYLGWCHGPPGTARLFYRLYEITGDELWMEWVKKSAKGIIDSGIPEKRTDGFWNNVGICCGSAGVGEFFLDLYRESGEKSYLDFARTLADDLLARAAEEGNGIKWIHAEHRLKPELLAAQTGYMQGAAGIGSFLLYLDAVEQGRDRTIKLPDTPF